MWMLQRRASARAVGAAVRADQARDLAGDLASRPSLGTASTMMATGAPLPGRPVAGCMNKQPATCWDVVHIVRRIMRAGSTTRLTGVTSMRRILTALGLLGVIAASAAPASAQYYGPGYGRAPDPYYRGYPRA